MAFMSLSARLFSARISRTSSPNLAVEHGTRRASMTVHRIRARGDGKMRRHHRGFTLIELLVIVSIIIMLIALLLPSVKRSREVARNAICMSNERQIDS